MHPPSPAAFTSAHAEREAVASVPPPLSRSPLIGREHEIETIRALLLRDDVPLVVLTGPDDVGKTRLAIAAAERVREHLPAGVSFVDLVSG